jgi:hypothetical protein
VFSVPLCEYAFGFLGDFAPLRETPFLPAIHQQTQHAQSRQCEVTNCLRMIFTASKGVPWRSKGLRWAFNFAQTHFKQFPMRFSSARAAFLHFACVKKIAVFPANYASTL